MRKHADDCREDSRAKRYDPQPRRQSSCEIETYDGRRQYHGGKEGSKRSGKSGNVRCVEEDHAVVGGGPVLVGEVSLVRSILAKLEIPF